MGMPQHLLETQLTLAQIDLGCDIKEEPLGSNVGYWVEEFQEDAGLSDGDAWCMGWVYSKHYKACRIQRISVPFLKRTGWCKGQWMWALKDTRLGVIPAKDIIVNKIQIPDGAIWIRYADDGTGHTGFVYDHDPDKNQIKTIEGNKSNRIGTGDYTVSNIADFKGVII